MTSSVESRTPYALDALAQVGRSVTWHIFFGVLTLALGVMVLAWPHQTLIVLAVLFGIQLILQGAFHLISSLAAEATDTAGRVLLAILGVLELVVGLYAVRHAALTVAVLGLLLGIIWIVEGIMLILSVASPLATGSRALTVVMGVLSLAAGVVLVSWPSISLATLAVVAGIWLVIAAVLQLAFAFSLRAAVRSLA